MKHFRVDEKAGYTRGKVRYEVVVVKIDPDDVDRRGVLFPNGGFDELRGHIRGSRRRFCLDLNERSYSYDTRTLTDLMELSEGLKRSGRRGLDLKGVPESDREIFTEKFPNSYFQIYEESKEDVVVGGEG